LSLFKLVENTDFVNKSVDIDLSSASFDILRQFVQECPGKEKENNANKAFHRKSSKPLALSAPPSLVKPSRATPQIQSKRQALPIFASRERILNTIENERIVLIQGSTGSGKTTQIPQYLLESATEKNLPCRILCTQPRRISAIASADRVSYERCDDSGTIGYQIRLESSVKPNTNCIFLTPGVFLRYLMTDSPEKLFNNITHILIDEAHERNKENDFLLTSIKEHFNDNPNLKLVIMSATMDTGVFAKYFGACEEISISTKMFDVQEIYLEDILKVTGFRNQRVDELNEKFKKGQLVEGCQSAYAMESEEPTEPIDPDLAAALNDVLDSLSTSDDPESYIDQFIHFVQGENAPVNFRHEDTKMTALMIAVGRGYVQVAEKLLGLNASISLKVMFNGAELNVLDISTIFHGEDSEMTKLLQTHAESCRVKPLSTSDVYNKALLNIYYDTTLKTKTNNFVIEEGIDHDLIAQLVEMLHQQTEKDGAILVFLPGHDDITQLSNMINERIRNGISMFLLHSSMKTEDQKNVFKPVMVGIRKIVLATNIAESSITIDDVVSLINFGESGKNAQTSPLSGLRD
jgi:ATP-dependent RNA helicase YTHDC2